MPKKPTPLDANEERLIANEIMRRLALAGERDQLALLVSYGRIAIERLDEKKPPTTTQGGVGEWAPV